MQWFVISVGLSVILTVLLNVGLRAFPETAHRLARGLTTFTSPNADPRTKDPRVRACIPWKAMVLGSLILTIVVNVVLWIGVREPGSLRLSDLTIGGFVRLTGGYDGRRLSNIDRGGTA